MADEIRHLKLGFASLASTVNTGTNCLYDAQQVETAFITYALVDDGQHQKWQTQTSSFSSFDPNWIGYRRGSVYEAEMGIRTLLGKQVNAETYLGFYEKLPKLCITQMPAYAITGTMYFRKDVRILDDEFTDIAFKSEEPVTYEDKECIKVTLSLDTGNSVAFFLRKWCVHKELDLICTNGLPEADSAPAVSNLPIDTKTLPLF